MSGIQLLAGALLILACGLTGSLALLHRARQLSRQEQAYGITTPRLRHLAALLGAAAGLLIGGLMIYYLSFERRDNAVEWIGRASYFLIAGASSGQLLVLIRALLLLRQEERAWQRDPVGSGSLGQQRLRALEELRRQHRHYLELVARDERVVDELIGVIGNPLLAVRRDLPRIPFYGYLGTVCGILLMAQDLGRIDEASQTFEVLSSMASGLVLAFRTTLVGLLAYLPLRRAADHLLQRLAELEDAWDRRRDEEAGG